jgi:hypothetical protein
MDKSKSQEDWVVLTDNLDTEDTLFVELKEKLTAADIAFVVQKTDDFDSLAYWILVKQAHFDDAYAILIELENTFVTAEQDAKWVKLTSFTYDTDPELAFLKNELRNNDIHFTVWNANLSSVHPLMGGGTGGVRVMVTENDAEKAVEILKEVHAQMEEVRKEMRPKATGCMGSFLFLVAALVYCFY